MDNREPELREIENECPQCGQITGSKVPGPSHEHEITGRLCLECLDKNCWTDYWEYRCDRPMQMTPKEAIDTYDDNIERARRKRDRWEEGE